MKKQDMVDKVIANYEYIEGFAERNVDTIYSGQTKQKYIAQVFMLQNERIVKRGYPFVVFNEGQVDEEAFWMSAGDPAPVEPELTFQAEMVAWLSSKLDEQVGPYILRHIEGVTANNAVGRGTANLILEDSNGDFLRKSVAIWKDTAEEWQFKEIQ